MRNNSLNRLGSLTPKNSSDNDIMLADRSANNFPRVDAWQVTGQASNLRPLHRESDAVTTTPPSHTPRITLTDRGSFTLALRSQTSPLHYNHVAHSPFHGLDEFGNVGDFVVDVFRVHVVAKQQTADAGVIHSTADCQVSEQLVHVHLEALLARFSRQLEELRSGNDALNKRQ